MIHESGRVPSNNEEGVLRGCTKWKAFIGRRWGKGAISKRKERILFRPGQLLLRGKSEVLSCRLSLLSLGGGVDRDGEGPPDRLNTSLVLTRKFQTGWLRSHF